MAAYARQFALNYAATFYNRVCSDGRVATKIGYPRFAPGALFRDIGEVQSEEDCTHFISCCIGRPPLVPINGIAVFGGGLPITQPFEAIGVYGQTYVPGLVNELITRGFAKVIGPTFVEKRDADTRDKIKANLSAGDLLAYASKDNSNAYEHFAILLGSEKICCHTTSRYGEDFLSVIAYRWLTLLKMP